MGNIPSSLGQLKKLTFLSLEYESICLVVIPPSIYNLSSQALHASHLTKFKGVFHQILAKVFLISKLFNVHSNQFTGSIPPSISNVTSVRVFDCCAQQPNRTGTKSPKASQPPMISTFNYNNIGSGKDGDLSFLSDLTNATQLRMADYGCEQQFWRDIAHVNIQSLNQT